MRAVYASGTPYTLTQTPHLVQFGTQSPSIALPRGVQRLVSARAVLDLSGCTFAAPATVTLKVRRTIGGTPGDLTRTQTTIVVGAIGTSGQNEVDAVIMLPPSAITTNPVGPSTIQLWASIDTLPATGAIRIREASIHVE